MAGQIQRELLNALNTLDPNWNAPPPPAPPPAAVPSPGDPGDVHARAAAYLDRLPPSVQGKRGSDALMWAARCMAWGFCLDEPAAIALLRDRFNPRCEPAWSPGEIKHKVADAAEGKGFNKPRGWLLAETRGWNPTDPASRPPRVETEFSDDVWEAFGGKPGATTGAGKTSNDAGTNGTHPTGQPAPTAATGPAASPPPAAPPVPPAGQWSGNGSTPPTPRVTVQVSPDAEKRVNDQVVAALASDPDLYQRGGELVRVVPDDATQGVFRRPASPRIVPVLQATLREHVCERVRFVQAAPPSQAEKGAPDKSMHPPEWCVKAVHARGRWEGIRPLDAVVDHPVVRPDGSILASNGYDHPTGLYLHTDVILPPVPDAPTLDDALAARDTLLEAVCDFPFQRQSHKSAWLAAVLTPLARFAFGGASPLFLFDANAPGSGKGLLCNSVAKIVSGKTFAVTDYAHNNDEMGKRIATMAHEGDRMVLMDNVEGPFGNRNLCAALTADRWKARLLGENRSPEALLVATWYATANNCQLGSDMARRVCHVRLECQEECPDKRTGFRHPNLKAWIEGRRPELLHAALTILSGYLRAGCPGADRLPPWGDYGDWSRVVRGAVTWVGMFDPIETANELRATADPRTTAFATLLAGWGRIDPAGHGLTANQIIGRVFPDDEHKRADPELTDLAEAIDSLGVSRTGVKLGYKLRGYRKRVLGGKYIDNRMSEGINKWFVYTADEGFSGDSRTTTGVHGAHQESESGDVHRHLDYRNLLPD